MVEPVGVEPTMHKGGGFTVHWGYQFSYDSILKHTKGTPQQSQDRLLLRLLRHYSTAYSTVSYLGFPSTFMYIVASQPVSWNILPTMHLAVLSTSNTF